MNKIIAAIALCSSLTGCASVGASNQDALIRESAKSIGGGLSLNQITVSNVDRGMTTVKWTATTPKGTYSCSADDMVRSTYCAQK